MAGSVRTLILFLSLCPDCEGSCSCICFYSRKGDWRSSVVSFCDSDSFQRRCLLFMLKCQWVFIAVLCLPLCTVFASHGIHDKFQTCLFSSMTAESPVSVIVSLSPLCLCPPPTFSLFLLFSTKSFSLSSLYSPFLWKKCRAMCVFFFHLVLHSRHDLTVFHYRAWLSFVRLHTLLNCSLLILHNNS